ncbi:N/A [soil metagenome]
MTTTAPATAGTRRKLPVWLETILLLVLALVVSILVKTFFVQMFFVPSGSMNPLFVKDDRIVVEKWSYWGAGDIERGDVVVFADPGGSWLGPLGTVELNPMQKVLARIGLYPMGGHLVKRVIGIEGDQVMCCDTTGHVSVNGVPLQEEDYILEGGPPSDRDFDITVPEGRLWVMGDNRSNSEDSRYHTELEGGGTIPESGVVGKVWMIVWPLDRFDVVDHPVTFGDPELLTSGR